MTSLVVGVAVSIVSTVLSVLLIVHICRKVRSKPLPLASASDQSCYQCASSSSSATSTHQLDSAAKLSSQVSAPVQSMVCPLAPLSPPRDSLGPGADTNVIYR